MNHLGLSLCTRYAFPPNSLSLCGPNRQSDLAYYSATGEIDKGTIENLTQFQTLYPYLCLIAGSTHKKDAFDPRVVEAYWIGNSLLNNMTIRQYNNFLDDTFALNKKLEKKERDNLAKKISIGGLPHHAFHVLNIYHRTGNIPDRHTIHSMDACIINWGTVTAINNTSFIVLTSPLRYDNTTLVFGTSVLREIEHAGKTDKTLATVSVGDTVTYHWGKFCTKINEREKKQLEFYTTGAVNHANNHGISTL